MSYLYSGVSIKNRRQSNMDSLLLKGKKIEKKDAFLAVVCDGVGSLENGAFAAGTSTRMLSEWFRKVTNSEDIGLRMRDTVLKINTYIVSEARHKGILTASTLSALLLIGELYYIVHVGDSRVYYYDDGTLLGLTNDDVSVSGKLTACIGQTENIILQYSEGSAADKLFILCSDGLYKRMNIDFMISNINTQNRRGLRESAEALIQYAISHGEQDNISLALVKTES